MKLFEISPLDYDSDVDYYDALDQLGKPKKRSTPPTDTVHPDVDSEEGVTRSIKNARLEPKFKGMEGDRNGKPYNGVIVYDGPRKKVQHNIRLAQEHTLRNIYHDVADVKIKPLEDGENVRGVIYVLVKKGSSYTPLLSAIEKAGIELPEGPKPYTG